MNFVQLTSALFHQVLAATLYGSVLALIILGIQWISGRRLGPAWRHALWLIVLARLIVPAFPESSFSLFNAPRWMLAMQQEEPKPRVTVTFLDPLPRAPLNSMALESSAIEPVVAQPASKPSLTPWEIVSLIWFGGCFILFTRLVIGSCWLRARLRTGAKAFDPDVERLLLDARARIRTLWRPRLVETACVESPGLFGALFPKILLPRGIATQLGPTELQHVLLHELAHLKRGDLWINLLMSLSHTVHWFNPVVWLVLRRMRLERELACDELVLRSTPVEEVRSYGETILKLLERVTARPALNAVLGILEEKHSAGSRLRQIAAFHSANAPSRACGVILFALLAVFGLSNAQSEKIEVEAPPGDIQESPRPAKATPAPAKSSILVRDGRLLLEMGKLDEAESKLNEALVLDPELRAARYYLQLIQERRNRIIATGGPEAPDHRTLFPRNALSVANPYATTNRVFPNSARKDLARRLEQIIVPGFRMEQGTPLIEVLKRLHKEAKEHDSQHVGVNFGLGPLTRVPGDFPLKRPTDQETISVADFELGRDLAISNGRLIDILQVLSRDLRAPEGHHSNDAVRFSIQDYAVVFEVEANDAPPALYTRTYRVNPNTFVQGLDGIFLEANPFLQFRQGASNGSSLQGSDYFRPLTDAPKTSGGINGVSTNSNPSSIQGAVRNFFVAAGFQFDEASKTPNERPQKAIFFNDRTGVLFVRGTLRDLDVVENALQVLNLNPPQVVIEAQVVELKPGAAYEQELLFRMIATNRIGGVVTVTELMSDPQFKAVIDALENRNTGVPQPAADRGVFTGVLPEPQFRQALAALKKAEGVTSLATPKVTTLTGRTARISIEPGPTIDVLPTVAKDGMAISLSTEVHVPADEREKRSEFKTKATSRVWTGQTMVIRSVRENGRTLIILLTPSIIDPAGNRVHSPEDIPEGVPPQNEE